MNNEFDYVNVSESNSPQPQTQPQEQPQTQQHVQPQPKPQYVTYVPYGLTPKTFEEHKAIKKTANIIGGAFLVMLAATKVIVFLIKLFLSVLGLWGVKEIAIFSDPAFLHYFQSMLSIITFTIPFAVLFKISGYRISSLIRFKKPDKKDILPYFFLGVGVCYFANYLVNIAAQIFTNLGISYDVAENENPAGICGVMLTVITYAVVPPLVEEFACRGIILGSLKKYGEGFAVLCSAILFGIVHGNFMQIPFAFLVGLVLGFITVKTNTIWIAVAVHAFNNGVSVLLDYIVSNTSEMVGDVVSIIILTACLLFIFIAVWLFKNRDSDALNFNTPKTESTEKQKIKWFFTSPTIIIFAILCLFKCLKYFS
jgi:membrane protease YdiL (CAAX protease family)